MTNTAEIFEMIQTRESESSNPSFDSIRAELERILESKTFQRARRLRSLLEYVVIAFTKGQASGQARTARELLGKGDDFDPSIDPVIRVQFGRLRRALTNYYATEGKRDSIIIGIPNRKYTPVFETASFMTVGPQSTNAKPNGHNGLQSTAPLQSSAPITNGSDENNGTGRPLVAVLPFANLTSDPSQDAFCYGLTEEIANGLASVTSVDVVASSSTFQFKDEHVDVREVGKELGVPLILEGSVRMEEGHTRVIAQLARSKDGVAVWSESFDDELNGSLNTQKSIAQKVMQMLPLSGHEA